MEFLPCTFIEGYRERNAKAASLERRPSSLLLIALSTGNSLAASFKSSMMKSATSVRGLRAFCISGELMSRRRAGNDKGHRRPATTQSNNKHGRNGLPPPKWRCRLVVHTHRLVAIKYWFDEYDCNCRYNVCRMTEYCLFRYYRCSPCYRQTSPSEYQRADCRRAIESRPTSRRTGWQKFEVFGRLPMVGIRQLRLGLKGLNTTAWSWRK